MRPIRTIEPGGELRLLLVRTRQDCPFLRPDLHGQVNRLILGVFAHTQRQIPMRLLGLVVLPHEIRILAWPRDTQEMSDFMHSLDNNISKEIGKLPDVRQRGGALWRDRFRSVAVSDRPEDQIACLEELLAAPCDQGFVDRPGDWPGIHSLGALTRGEELQGTWHDRRAGTSEDLQVRLTPLPCWASLSNNQRRVEVEKLRHKIEARTAARRKISGPCQGAQAVIDLDPRVGPKDVPRWVTPAVFSLSAEIRRRLREAYEEIDRAYRKAADLLKRIEPPVAFPPGTFPPPLPFVAPASGHPP